MIPINKLFDLIKRLYNMTSLRCIASSGIALVIDYFLLLIIRSCLGEFPLAMEIAAVIAWIISSQTNFWINRLWVFQSKGKILHEMGGYYSLAAVSFAVKTFILLELLTRVLSVELSIAKLIVEVTMFAVNYLVQKKVIFKK